MRRSRHSKDIRSVMVTLCGKIMTVSTSSQAIKKFVGQFNEAGDCKEFCDCVLSLLVQVLESSSPREVFTFSGKANSGIKLQPINSLPKKGFCFFGGIYVEAAGKAGTMTIFKLSNSTKAIELFVHNDFLHYQLTDGGEEILIAFAEAEIESGKWHLIELYHLNEESQNNLQLYIDFVLVESVTFRPYTHKLGYDANTIGCVVDLENEGTERNFLGEMTALCFFGASTKTAPHIHNALLKGQKSLLEIVDIESVGAEIWDKLFLYANPKSTSKIGFSIQQVLTVNKRDKGINVHNNVVHIYTRTKIEHLALAKDSFFDIGGVRTIIPLMYRAINKDLEPEFMYEH